MGPRRRRACATRSGGETSTGPTVRPWQRLWRPRVSVSGLAGRGRRRGLLCWRRVRGRGEGAGRGRGGSGGLRAGLEAAPAAGWAGRAPRPRRARADLGAPRRPGRRIRSGGFHAFSLLPIMQTKRTHYWRVGDAGGCTKSKSHCNPQMFSAGSFRHLKTCAILCQLVSMYLLRNGIILLLLKT